MVRRLGTRILQASALFPSGEGLFPSVMSMRSFVADPAQKLAHNPHNDEEYDRRIREMLEAEASAVRTSRSSLPSTLPPHAHSRQTHWRQILQQTDVQLHRPVKQESDTSSCPSTSGRPFAAALAAPKPRPSSPSKHTQPTSPADSPSPSSWRSILASAKQLYTPEDLTTAPLTDSHSRAHSYLRISLTERCNLRCLYCMPEEGVDLTPQERLLTREEITRLARLFVASGVSKVRLTGGEPTLRKDLVEICRDLKHEVGVKSLLMTSNGIVLARMLPELKAAGLDGVNISLDTLRPDRFETMTRRKGIEKVLRSIDTAVGLGLQSVKVNVVVMRGVNDDELGDFVALTRDRAVNVRFIEYMPFDGNVWSDQKLVTYKEMFDRVQESLGPSNPLVRIADPKGEVAKNFRPAGGDYQGSVSFITSMTEHFCHECNRVRLMADGNLKVCLFGHNEVSLRDAVREGASNEDLQYIVKASLMKKKERHAGMFEIARQSKDGRAMVKIGG